jgi:hypothetical protein
MEYISLLLPQWMAKMPNVKVEQLLALFVTRALGLTLEAEICDAKVPSTAARVKDSPGNAAPTVYAAWNCDRGTVRICGRYDAAQSQYINAHVVFVEWWVESSTHHAGWWRSSVDHPGEWTKGYGRSPAVAAGFEVEERHAHPVTSDIA